MSTPHSTLKIPAARHFGNKIVDSVGKYKLFIIIGALIATVPAIVGLTFADSASEPDSVLTPTEEGDISGEVPAENDEGSEQPDDSTEQTEDDVEEPSDEPMLAQSGDDPDQLDENVVEPTENDADEPSCEFPQVCDNQKIDGLEMPIKAGGMQKNLPVVRKPNTYQPAYGNAYQAPALPARYDSREQSFAAGVGTKNQNTEGLCWANSGNTSIEYLIAKSGLMNNPVLSPKHLDYQNVAGSKAYNESGKNNAFYDRLVAAYPASDRELGNASTIIGIAYAYSNPLALTSESNFTTVLKQNDARLSGISKYEDIWTIDGLGDTVLTEEGKYTKKQNYEKVNNQETTDYFVTGLRAFDPIYYDPGADRSAALAKIKSIIRDYGAFQATLSYDQENCMADLALKHENGAYIHDSEGRYYLNAVLVDDSTSAGATSCDPSSGHAMTIVGWDDDFEYTVDDEEKRGAFIVQNSWGDIIANLRVDDTTTIQAHVVDYISYDSYLIGLYYTSVEPLNYDKIYSVDDYRPASISPADNELVYEFNSEGAEKLEEMVFTEGIFNDNNLDVYFSPNGTASGFSKIGTLHADFGINKFAFPANTRVNGDFAIKLVASDQIPPDYLDAYRTLDVVSLYSNSITPQTFTLTLDADEGVFYDEESDDFVTTRTLSCTTTEASCQITLPDDLAEEDRSYIPYIPDQFEYDDDGNIVESDDYLFFYGWADTKDTTTPTYLSAGTITLSANKTIYAVYDVEAPAIPDTSGSTSPDAPSAPNTGFFTKPDGSLNVCNLAILVSATASVALALFIFSRKYQITKKSHLRGKIDIL